MSSRLQASNIFTVAKRNVEGQDMLYQSLKLTNGIWVLAELRVQPGNPSLTVRAAPRMRSREGTPTQAREASPIRSQTWPRDRWWAENIPTGPLRACPEDADSQPSPNPRLSLSPLCSYASTTPPLRCPEPQAWLCPGSCLGQAWARRQSWRAGGAGRGAAVVVISVSLFGCCMSAFPAGAVVQDLEVSRLLFFPLPRRPPPALFPLPQSPGLAPCDLTCCPCKARQKFMQPAGRRLSGPHIPL